MTKRKKKWLLGIGILTGLAIGAIFAAAFILAQRFEPYIREQAIQYLRDRFDSEVELETLQVHMPRTSALRLLLSRQRGAVARVEGSGLIMRHKGRHDVPPMFAMNKFTFEVDLGTLFATPKIVPLVTLDGMEINIPPKGERPSITASKGRRDDPPPSTAGESNPGVIIENVIITNSALSILPRDPKKLPLDFDIHRLRLESVGKDVAMKYDAELSNAKPPGEIRSTGVFGPWEASEPGDTALAGKYNLDDADLGVFSGIAGILNSSGTFEGSLDSINVHGEATVPDFRLEISGNPVPLSTRFEVLVDGTNGNTILKPVVARLGKTDFTTSGGVIRHESDPRRTVALDVSIPKGNLPDLMRLAMKGKSFMEGQIFLKTKIVIPPLSGKVREKLLLDGEFNITQGRFLRSTIQDQIDTLSRRGQGQPKNEEIDEVFSSMTGKFKLENGLMSLRSLSFGVPGADVFLAGSFNLKSNDLDFHGTLKLRAKVSQTMSGWKRIVLKPVDPFFSKQGAGTFLRIKVDGTADSPKFGLDRGKDNGKDKEQPKQAKAR